MQTTLATPDTIPSTARPRSPEIIARCAELLGLRGEDVAETVRRLREDDLFVRETRWPSSPRPDTQHVTNLLVAILSGASAKGAARAVTRASFLQWDNDNSQTFAEHRSALPRRLGIFRRRDHRFVDAVEELVAVATVDAAGFDRLAESSFIALGGTWPAMIYLSTGMGLLQAEDERIDGTWTYYDPNDPGAGRPRLLTRESRIAAKAIGELGLLLAGSP